MTRATRTEHVWVAEKNGAERRYTSAVPFSEEFAKVLRDEGFTIRRLDYEVADCADVASPAVSREV